jgi:putative membrane protein
LRFEKLSGPLGRYDGLAFIAGGLALIVIATARFFRAGRLIDDPETHAGMSVRGELILGAILVIAMIGFTALLVVG